MDISPVQAKDFISRQSLRDVAPALWAGLFYYLGAALASALANAPVPMPNLRPGAAILLAALLASPRRCWLGILLAALSVHLFATLHHDVPMAVALAWFAGNCSQALLGVAGVAWLLHQPLRLDLLRHAIIFVTWCAFLAPAAGSLLEAAMLRAAGALPGPLWPVWVARLAGSAAVMLMVIPVRINRPPVRRLAEFSPERRLEAGLLLLALLAAGGTSLLGAVLPASFGPLLAYLPLPLLLWAAMRFGTFGAGFAFLLFALFAILATAFGNGPFVADLRDSAGLFLPLYLAGVAVPLVLLSAAVQERRGTLAALRQEQGRLGLALAAERKRAEHLVRERHARAEVEQRIAERTFELRRAQGELQRQREQLAHLTRVGVLGELSGALAHELNQPLAAILSNAQAARRFLAQPGADLGEIREILDDIVEEDKRAGEVIRRVRALFRKGELVLRPLDVAALVRETLAFAHGNLAERGVSVRLDLEDTLFVRGDRVQLQQVLLNLIVNACDAMQGQAPAQRQLCIRAAGLPGGEVQVSVADTGPGIAPGLADRIFEPFVSTKTDGLGFGLSISREIINQHGGRLDAANGKAGGAELRISLPRYSGGTDV
jgi:signal transduction histidine kinase